MRLKKWSSISFVTLFTLSVAQGPAFGSSIDQKSELPAKVTLVAAPNVTYEKFLVKGTGVAQEMSSAQEQDLRTRAKQTGESLNDLFARFGDQEYFDAVITKVESENKETFVEVSNRDGEKAAWIKFTDKPSDTVLKMLGNLPQDIEVRYGAPLNSSELARLQQHLFVALSRIPGIDEATSTIDPVTDSVSLEYEPTENLKMDPSVLQQVVLKAGANALDLTALPVDVSFEPKKIDDKMYANVYGGVIMTYPLNDGTSDICTTGFPIKVGGVNGVATAMHCPNGLRYNDTLGIISYQNAASQFDSDSYIDLQWHKVLSGSSVFAQFQAYNGTFRPVDAAVNAAVTDNVCMFGKGSNLTRCGSVTSRNACKTYVGGGLEFCGLAVVQGQTAAKGDSGGPAFNATTAHGYISGGNSAQTYYTPQTRVAESLNGQVLIAP